MKTLTELPAWQSLLSHYEANKKDHMSQWFSQDHDRAFRFSLKTNGILLDYSRNRLKDETLHLLFELARSIDLKSKIQGLFNGQIVNVSEKRPALHTVLRDQRTELMLINNENIIPLVKETKARLHHFVNSILKHSFTGITGKPITDIITVGIGGSHLGPMMTVHALKDYAVSSLKFHFVSGVDPLPLTDILNDIDPSTSLFIISSKTFSTLETMTNFAVIKSWIEKKLANESSLIFKHHFVAITAYPEKALAKGFIKDNIFPIWEWVGGRYSIWSAVGLPLMLMIGTEGFEAFLQGAFQMDQHFLHADLAENMPVILALIGIWYINFFDAPVYAIMPYFHRLRHLIPYLQQADMESNGKAVSLQGEVLSYRTGPVLFGEEGCHAQHAYHQLLHQGKHFIPVDFILPSQYYAKSHSEQILLASGLSQAEALLHGKSYQQVYEELRTRYETEKEARQLALHQMMPGNKPSNILFLDDLSPYTLGALLALYEHKIYTQGLIWNINSFDQWGVELGKQLLPAILKDIENVREEVNKEAAP